MRVVIRGAGDLASGVALRLWRAGMDVVLLDVEKPTAIRRTVAFSEAIVHGKQTVEDVTARLATAETAEETLAAGMIPVLVDPEAAIRTQMPFDAEVDAILAKYNVNTRIDDAPIVLALGPGFTAGVDCHGVIETKRGHYLGRLILEGSAIPNTGVMWEATPPSGSSAPAGTASSTRWPTSAIRSLREMWWPLWTVSRSMP